MGKAADLRAFNASIVGWEGLGVQREDGSRACGLSF